MNGNPAVQQIAPPANTLLWATAATAHASSWFHLDDHGMATTVNVESGMKLWIVARPKPGHRDTAYTNFGAARPFSEWEPHFAGEDFFDHEAVLLTAGDSLLVANVALYSSRIIDGLTLSDT
jgi:hypothetical protein